MVDARVASGRIEESLSKGLNPCRKSSTSATSLPSTKGPRSRNKQSAADSHPAKQPPTARDAEKQPPC